MRGRRVEGCVQRRPALAGMHSSCGAMRLIPPHPRHPPHAPHKAHSSPAHATHSAPPRQALADMHESFGAVYLIGLPLWRNDSIHDSRGMMKLAEQYLPKKALIGYELGNEVGADLLQWAPAGQVGKLCASWHSRRVLELTTKALVSWAMRWAQVTAVGAASWISFHVTAGASGRMRRLLISRWAPAAGQDPFSVAVGARASAAVRRGRLAARVLFNRRPWPTHYPQPPRATLSPARVLADRSRRLPREDQRVAARVGRVQQVLPPRRDPAQPLPQVGPGAPAAERPRVGQRQHH